MALAFLSGLAGVLSLRQGGFPQEACFLQLRRPSRGSLIALLVLSLALWPVLAGGRWVGANLQAAFLQAAGGVAQELFFRAVLLPLLLALFPGRPLRAIFLHAVLFSIWHAGAFLVTPAGMIAGPIAIMTVSFIGGLVWGVVTVRDGTVVWATIQHTLFWVIGSMFALGPP